MERKREEKKKDSSVSKLFHFVNASKYRYVTTIVLVYTKFKIVHFSFSLYIYTIFFFFFSFFYFHFLNITTFDRSYNKKKKNKRSLKTILIIVRIFNLYNAVENNFEYLTKYGTNNYYIIKFFLLFHPNFKPCILLAFTLM